MALFPCPECNHQISDKANACPNCGAPVSPLQPTFFLRIESDEVGPRDIAELQELYRAKVIDDLTPARHAESNEWSPLGEVVPNLFRAAPRVELPSNRSITARGAVGFAMAAILLTGVAWFVLSDSKPTIRRFGTIQAKGHEVLTPDDRAIETLVRRFYEFCNAGDYDGVHSLMTEDCREALSVDDLRPESHASYTYLRLESLEYRRDGELAIATARRTVRPALSEEGLREFKCKKERGQWRLIRDYELTDKTIRQFLNGGFSAEVRQTLQTFRKCDPFLSLPVNDTNAFEQLFRKSYDGDDLLPWEFNVSILSNRFDRTGVTLFFEVRNVSKRPWNNGLALFRLRTSSGDSHLSSELLPRIEPGQASRGEAEFISLRPLWDDPSLAVDIDYRLASKDFSIATNLPLHVERGTAAESIEFEVSSTGFDSVESSAASIISVGRIDFRIKNISGKALENGVLKFVWREMSGEIIDQSSYFIVGYGELPLATGETKKGFETCPKGYAMPLAVKADVYLEGIGPTVRLKEGIIIKPSGARAPVTSPSALVKTEGTPVAVAGIVQTRVTERNESWWKWSWMVPVKAGHAGATITLDVQFLDARGFVVERDKKYEVTLRPNESRTISDFDLIDVAVSRQIVRAVVKIEE